MTPRLQSQKCKFFTPPLSRKSQKRLEHKENQTKYRKMTRKPWSHVTIFNISNVGYWSFNNDCNKHINLLRPVIPKVMSIFVLIPSALKRYRTPLWYLNWSSWTKTWNEKKKIVESMDRNISVCRYISFFAVLSTWTSLPFIERLWIILAKKIEGNN